MSAPDPSRAWQWAEAQRPSWPGLTRPTTHHRSGVVGRVKPGHDVEELEGDAGLTDEDIEQAIAGLTVLRDKVLVLASAILGAGDQ